jgi:hypothetical protein
VVFFLATLQLKWIQEMVRGSSFANNNNINKSNEELDDGEHQQTGRDERCSTSDVRDFMMSVGVQDNVNIVEPVPRAVPGAIMVGATNDTEDDDTQSGREEGSARLEVRDFMMSLGVQNNVNIVEAVPGAIRVGATNDAEDDTQQLDVGEDISDGPIIAHLAPDETNFEEMFEERLAARIAHDRMESRSQEVYRTTREISLVSYDNVVVVADEVKETSTYYCGLTKRHQWICAMIIVLVLAGGVAAYLLLRNENSEDSPPRGELTEDFVPTPTVSQSEAPSFSPLPLDPPLFDELRSWIAPTSEDLLPFNDPSSPQSQALAWLYDDPISMTPGRSTRTVLERYVLAVLYYTTSGPSWRFDYLSRDDVCMWNEDGQTVESLLAVNSTLQSNGVYCLDYDGGGSIAALILMGNNLRGPIPWELFLLTNLEVFNVESNGLTGSIPSRINELTNLEFLSLNDNGLTGSIPAALNPLTRLEVFWAQFNALMGPLPETFSPVTTSIFLDANHLTGSIPESWGLTMPWLQSVTLVGNSLTGTLPSTFGQLSTLSKLFLNHNMLTGTIPLEMTQLSSLVVFSMKSNSFRGSVQETLCSSLLLPQLITLSADCDEVDCPCCTICCYDNQLFCDEEVEQGNVTRRRIL